MGHQIEYQVSVGDCQLTQCSCGRGALKVKSAVMLLSSTDVKQMKTLFSGLGRSASEMGASLADKLKGLTGRSDWENFSVPL